MGFAIGGFRSVFGVSVFISRFVACDRNYD